MPDKTYTDPAVILHKLDYEGDDGITWFTGSEFEDDELAEFVDEANHLYTDLQILLSLITNRAEELSNAKS